uniref:DUF6598 domain-containing protein n=2 Tax=Leersia perrieri TaxID=77586 RepID=A0A0D9X492_9ORYZ
MEMEMKKAAAAMARQRSLRNQVLGKLRKESAEEWESRVRKSLEEQNKAYLEQIAGDPEDEESQCAIDYRRFWNDVWFPRRGSFRLDLAILRHLWRPQYLCDSLVGHGLMVFRVNLLPLPLISLARNWPVISTTLPVLIMRGLPCLILRGEKVVVTDDGKIELARRVVSVDIDGELKVSVKAWELDINVVENVEVFTPLETGLSKHGFCELEITVAWSLISGHPVFADSVLEETEEERAARLEERIDRDMASDCYSWQASCFRSDWQLWFRCHGSFEDTTRIPPMRYTHKPPAERFSACVSPTLQIFSVKVGETRGDLRWPLHVFGIVAMRDDLDRNRNIVFHRTRDNCQTLTKEDRNLVLVGPTRAVTLSTPHPMIIEVELKVKGTTESEDKDLSYLAVRIVCNDTTYSRMLKSCSYTSKLSTMEFSLGYVAFSVEATISVQIIRGSWPDSCRGLFTAFTTGFHCKGTACEDSVASIDDERIVLLDSRGAKVVVNGDGKIELSRRVVSAESLGKLNLSVKAWEVDNNVVEKVEVFPSLEAGLSKSMIAFDFCTLEVIVGWSLISCDPVFVDTVV